MFKILRKADIILIVLLIVCGLAGSAFLVMTQADMGSAAKVTVDGKEYGTYPLSEDRTVDLGTGNIVSVKDGSVYMESATCTGQDCVHEGKISKPGRTIVCLPHKVLIEIEGGGDGFDTISK